MTEPQILELIVGATPTPEILAKPGTTERPCFQCGFAVAVSEEMLAEKPDVKVGCIKCAVGLDPVGMAESLGKHLGIDPGPLAALAALGSSIGVPGSHDRVKATMNVAMDQPTAELGVKHFGDTAGPVPDHAKTAFKYGVTTAISCILIALRCSNKPGQRMADYPPALMAAFGETIMEASDLIDAHVTPKIRIVPVKG